MVRTSLWKRLEVKLVRWILVLVEALDSTYERTIALCSLNSSPTSILQLKILCKLDKLDTIEAKTAISA